MVKKTPDRRALEKTFSDLGRLLDNKKFDSEDKVNKYLKKIVKDGRVPEMPPKSALDFAQDIVYEAWDTEDEKKRIKLAKEALSISADCADAYVLLAEETAGTLKEEKALYEEGVKAGERALGKEIFEEDEGHFWGILQTRPYMRARAGLAQCLWDLSEFDVAIAHYRDMLRLNRNDNQGIRYILIRCLAEIERYDELEDFMKSGGYDGDCGVEWIYTEALLGFMREGPSEKANRILAMAIGTNHYVPDYLSGRKKPSAILPDMVIVGGEDEGMCYAANFIKVWKKINGALEWLEKHPKVQAYRKVDRNSPCPCGSGKKYKKCCGR